MTFSKKNNFFSMTNAFFVTTFHCFINNLRIIWYTIYHKKKYFNQITPGNVVSCNFVLEITWWMLPIIKRFQLKHLLAKLITTYLNFGRKLFFSLNCNNLEDDVVTEVLMMIIINSISILLVKVCLFVLWLSHKMCYKS